MSGPTLIRALATASPSTLTVPPGPADGCGRAAARRGSSRHRPAACFPACFLSRSRAGGLVTGLFASLFASLLLLGLGLLSLPAQAREPGRPLIEAVDLDELPVQVRKTLVLIKAGGPFPYRKDGTVFGNRERLLPPRPRGHYTEYTVPTPRARNRGARRIVAAGEPTRTDEFYYTDDHYQSFRRIREPG